MGFIRKETYKVPDFCADCPAMNGMTNVEIRKTTNTPPPIETFYVAGQYSDPLIYAHDPGSPEAGEVVLGKDYTVDAFCVCCEFATSRALNVANRAVDACTGPVNVKYGLFKRKTRKVCGAGLEKDDLRRVRRLERAGAKQGRSATRSVDVIVSSAAREV